MISRNGLKEFGVYGLVWMGIVFRLRIDLAVRVTPEFGREVEPPKWNVNFTSILEF